MGTYFFGGKMEDKNNWKIGLKYVINGKKKDIVFSGNSMEEVMEKKYGHVIKYQLNYKDNELELYLVDKDG